MKAIVFTQYGPPDVLQLKDVQKPAPKDNEVLIRIHATTVTSEDCTFRKGSPFAARMAIGIRKPKITILGSNLAGTIEKTGKDVTLFKAGNNVYAASDASFGTHAEYISIPDEGAIALKPENMNHAEAVSISAGASTALPFLRDHGKIQAGHQVLVNGASGSVGTAAVQLAKNFGATVTAVCSTKNLEVVRSLCADRLIDYTKTDFTTGNDQYDIIFDTVGKSSFSRCKPILKSDGIYLCTVLSASILFQMFWTSLFGKKKAVITFTGLRKPEDKARDLIFLKELAEAGKIMPVIGKIFPLEQAVQAHQLVDTGHKMGNVIMTP